MKYPHPYLYYELKHFKNYLSEISTKYMYLKIEPAAIRIKENERITAVYYLYTRSINLSKDIVGKIGFLKGTYKDWLASKRYAILMDYMKSGMSYEIKKRTLDLIENRKTCYHEWIQQNKPLFDELKKKKQ